jgi:hypothetical protein
MRFTSSQQIRAEPSPASREGYFPRVTRDTNGLRPGLPDVRWPTKNALLRAAARLNYTRVLARALLFLGPYGRSAERITGYTRGLGLNQTLDITKIGGGRGIRTPERVTPLTVFKTAAFNHSAIPPAVIGPDSSILRSFLSTRQSMASVIRSLAQVQH